MSQSKIRDMSNNKSQQLKTLLDVACRVPLGGLNIRDFDLIELLLLIEGLFLFQKKCGQYFLFGHSFLPNLEVVGRGPKSLEVVGSGRK